MLTPWGIPVRTGIKHQLHRESIHSFPDSDYGSPSSCPTTLNISLWQCFPCCAVIACGHFCLPLWSTNSSGAALCLTHLCVCRARNTVIIYTFLIKGWMNEWQMNGHNYLTDYFLPEVDKNSRNIGKIFPPVTSEGNGKHSAFFVLWKKEHNKEKDLSQLRNVISWSRTLCPHLRNCSSTLLFF